MTIHNRWELQKALIARLEEALENQAFPPDDPDDETGDVPVVVDITEGNHPLFVRIDGFGVLQGASGAGHIDRHTFMAHVFCVNTPSDSDLIVDGGKEVARIQSLVVSALDGWEPLTGASGIEHISTADAPDEDPATHHGVSKFKVMIHGG
ncbi:hypothetical protein GN241_11050 [Rhodobacteraceae bacterium IMCC1335]